MFPVQCSRRLIDPRNYSSETNFPAVRKTLSNYTIICLNINIDTDIEIKIEKYSRVFVQGAIRDFLKLDYSLDALSKEIYESDDELIREEVSTKFRYFKVYEKRLKKWNE